MSIAKTNRSGRLRGRLRNSLIVKSRIPMGQIERTRRRNWLGKVKSTKKGIRWRNPNKTKVGKSRRLELRSQNTRTMHLKALKKRKASHPELPKLLPRAMLPRCWMKYTKEPSKLLKKKSRNRRRKKLRQQHIAK